MANANLLFVSEVERSKAVAGQVNTGFVEENTGRVVQTNLTAGQTFVYPQGTSR